MYKGILDRGFPVTGAADINARKVDLPVDQKPAGLCNHGKRSLLRSEVNEDVNLPMLPTQPRKVDLPVDQKPPGLCNHGKRALLLSEVNEDVNLPDPDPSPEAFLRRHANLGGAKIVAVLRSTPGQVYSPQELICLSRGEYPTPGQLHALDLDPIPLADTRALAAYLKRRNQLRAQITAGNNNPDLAWELDFLEKELKRIGKPGGGIKNSRPERDKAYHNLMTQLWRLFRAAHKEDPRLCAWLKTRIKTGRLFAWVETT